MSSKEQEAAKKRVMARAKCYCAESNLKNKQTKQDLAVKAAGLYEHYWVVLMSSLTGQGRAEETRTLPSIASNYKRIMDALGVTAERTDDDGGAL
jgi:hypothetical protein